MKKLNKKYSLAVVLSGVISGFTGVFRRYLDSLGIDSLGFVFIRSFFGLFFFALAIKLSGTEKFKVKLRDFWCFLGAGLVSFLGFNLCYFQAMTMMSLSAAAVLLYSSPAFVVILSALIFKEKITKRKCLSVLLAISGCFLTCGIITDKMNVSWLGLLIGLGSGFGYALFSIFSKIAIGKGYGSNTINFWSCLLAVLALLIPKAYEMPLNVIYSVPSNLLLFIAVGFITCFLPYLLYTYGLIGMEASRVSIIISIEPIVATLVGIIFFKEHLDIWKVFGIIFVITAILILNKESDIKADQIEE